MTRTFFQKNVQTVWDYLRLNHSADKADIMLVLGNHDLKTIEHAVSLFKRGKASKMLISGGKGKATPSEWETEAEAFADIALKQGLNPKDLILETKATNTGENFAFSKSLLDSLHLSPKSLLVVTKPYMERRAYATGKIHFPKTRLFVSSVDMDCETYLAASFLPEREIEIMLGDFSRIDKYPALGFQIAQNIPLNVRKAFDELVSHGFDRYVIKE